MDFVLLFYAFALLLLVACGVLLVIAAFADRILWSPLPTPPERLMRELWMAELDARDSITPMGSDLDGRAALRTVRA